VRAGVRVRAAAGAAAWIAGQGARRAGGARAWKWSWCSKSNTRSAFMWWA